MMKDVFSILRESITIPLVANIPHSSTYIPPSIKQSFVLNNEDLEKELLKLTDRYVDELFSCVHEMGGVSVFPSYTGGHH